MLIEIFKTDEERSIYKTDDAYSSALNSLKYY